MVVTPASGGGPESSVSVDGTPASTSVSSLTSGNHGDVPGSRLVVEGSEVDGAALVSVAGEVEAPSDEASVTPEEVDEGKPASEVSSVVGARSVVSVISSVDPVWDADDSPIVASGVVMESASPMALDEPASVAGALASPDGFVVSLTEQATTEVRANKQSREGCAGGLLKVNCTNGV
jgi:hypothetical protein